MVWHFVDGIKEILESNGKFHLDHRYNSPSCECEGECDGENCVWFYDTAEDWYYDDYVYNCHTGLDGVIDFEQLKDYWTVKKFCYQECSICWNYKEDCNAFIEYDLRKLEEFEQESYNPDRRLPKCVCPQNLVWCYK